MNVKRIPIIFVWVDGETGRVKHFDKRDGGLKVSEKAVGFVVHCIGFGEIGYESDC